MLEIDYSSLKEIEGLFLGVSDWIEVSQERIDGFAKVTEDRQWIHTNPEKAAGRAPGTTIAHGFLTLSFVSKFVEELLVVTGSSMAINYGLNRVRFPSILPSGSRVRGSIKVTRVEVSNDWVQVLLNMEIKGENIQKPVCVTEMIIRFLPSVDEQ